MLSWRGQATQLSSSGNGLLFSYKDRNLWLDHVAFSYVLIYHVLCAATIISSIAILQEIEQVKERRNIGFGFRRLLLYSCCRAHAASFDRSRTSSFSCYPFSCPSLPVAALSRILVVRILTQASLQGLSHTHILSV